jgi:hypothetical protein
MQMAARISIGAFATDLPAKWIGTLLAAFMNEQSVICFAVVPIL